MNSEIQNIKQRFSIIGNDHSLNMAIEKSLKVSPTDITVLVMGEGVGKEVFLKLFINFLTENITSILLNYGPYLKAQLTPNYLVIIRSFYRGHN